MENETQSAADQVVQVVDHVAAKLADAGTAAKPLAETIVREYALSNVAVAIGCVTGCAIAGFVIYLGYKLCRSYDEHKCEEGRIIGGVVLIAGAIAGFAVAFINLVISAQQAIAPHYHILKDLIGR